MAFNPNEHLMDLKGKRYLQVMWRLVWAREDLPMMNIFTECLEHDDKHAIFKATIKCGDDTLAQAHGSETVNDFKDFLEKAETKAVGRALAMCGYGTQFTGDEFDEGKRIVDSPADLDKTIVPEVVPCERCGKPITGVTACGQSYTPGDLIAKSKLTYGGCYCFDCMRKLNAKKSDESGK